MGQLADVPRFLVVGESLVDIVVPLSGTPHSRAGGSPMNVAVGLARLGVDTTLMTEVGDDPLGEVVTSHLRDSAVRLDPSSVVPGSRTSTATARLDESGAASYEFDVRWTLGDRSLPAGTGALHVGSLGIALQPGRESVVRLVEEAAQAGALVSVDPNARPGLTPDPDAAWADVREVAALAQVVKVSDEDLHFLRPGSEPDDLADELLRGPTRLVVVTAGGEGAVAFSREGRADIRSRPVDLVDTVGAGDSFMAGLLAVVAAHGLEGLDRPRLTAYVQAAHQAAAVTVSRRGADPPRLADLPAGWPVL